MSTNKFMLSFNGSLRKFKAVVPMPGSCALRTIDELYTEMVLFIYRDDGCQELYDSEKVIVAGSQRVKLPSGRPGFADWAQALKALDLELSWKEYHDVMDSFHKRCGDMAETTHRCKHCGGSGVIREKAP